MLIVEDDAAAREMMRQTIEKMNLPVAEAVDGREALEWLDVHPEPAIILLDLNMPRKDGREALAEIKGDEDLRHIPVVVLTTSSDQMDVRRAYDLGANS